MSRLFKMATLAKGWVWCMYGCFYDAKPNSKEAK